jgi:excisionase family DNA binding protein
MLRICPCRFLGNRNRPFLRLFSITANNTALACTLARQIERVVKMSSDNATSGQVGPIQQPVRDYENKKQFAERLGVSLRTVDNLLARGMPHVKLTRKLVRIPRMAADEWIAERLVRRA